MMKMENVDRCICCGEIIPEGMLACPNCLVASKQQAMKSKQFDEKLDFDYAAEDDR
jgi:hypothetical protein